VPALVLILPGEGRQKMKKTIVMIFLVAAMLMIWGCEPKLDGSWIRPHGTADDFYRDRTECANEAKKGSLTNEPFDLLFSRCMQSKGYSWQQDPW